MAEDDGGEIRGRNACTLRRLEVSNGLPFATPESGHLWNRATRTVHFHLQVCIPWLKLNTGNILTDDCVLSFVFVWTTSLGAPRVYLGRITLLRERITVAKTRCIVSSVSLYDKVVVFEDVSHERVVPAWYLYL